MLTEKEKYEVRLYSIYFIQLHDREIEDRHCTCDNKHIFKDKNIKITNLKKITTSYNKTENLDVKIQKIEPKKKSKCKLYSIEWWKNYHLKRWIFLHAYIH